MFGHTNEPFILVRDLYAVIIPAGEKLLLREGTSGFITQALGGSFTIYIEGNLFRVAGADLSLIHISRCRRYSLFRSRWSTYH